MLKNNYKVILGKYFEENTIIESSLDSFNRFIDEELQNIIEENKEVEPTIIPASIDEFKIRFDKIWIVKPEITEADGSKRIILPSEARLRKMTYSAPVFIEVSAHTNGVQRETFQTQIASLPIMLKSKYCHLNGMDRQKLIEVGEDPDDPGGYFIINGTEKVIVNVEDLASNKFMVEKQNIGPSQYTGKIFSEKGSFKIPHTIERLKDGIFYLSFTRVKRVPIIIVMKALGLLKDEDIMRNVSETEQYDEIFINLYEFLDIKTQDDAIDWIAKFIGITQPKEVRKERMIEIMEKYLLPHLGTDEDHNTIKAINLCKYLKRFILVSRGILPQDDKDHYANKRLKLAGDLMGDLFRVNLKVLIGDLLYNFQRIVKRGKFPSLKIIIRDKLLTSRIYSAMATGNWTGGRKGICQRIQRHNFLDSLSHLQRVVSPLSTTQENFEARELHSTHLGRLCPIETPEGTNIGLKKNLPLFASITKNCDVDEVAKSLKNIGLQTV